MQSGPHITAGVREGDVLAGKYRVERVLGIGGMGVVVAAHHLQLDQRVALKFLLPEALGNAAAVTRFAREARAAVRIKSEHVARVSDVGTLESGAPYMVMEYLEGGDLSAWLKQYGPLPLEQAVEFLLQACEAIAEAHSLGIIHRDLKPANLFVIRRPDGTYSVKVLDFGISKTTVSSGGHDMTSTAAVMGSPLYMSPEQMQSAKDVDPRTDIWALGVILYELLAGYAPFNADTITELILKIISTTPAPIRAQRPDVPTALDAVLARCLEKDRNRRYSTVGELASALAEFGSKRARMSVERISGLMKEAGLSSSALALPPSSDAPNGSAYAGTGASWGRTASTRTGGKTVVVVGLVVTVAVAIGAGAWLTLGRGAATGATTTAPSVGPAPLPSSAAMPTTPSLPLLPAPSLRKIIASEPAHATVVIDGKEIGTTPFALSVPATGSVSVSLKSTGYKEAERTFTAQDPDDVTIRLEADPESTQAKPPSAPKVPGTAPRVKLAPR